MPQTSNASQRHNTSAVPHTAANKAALAVYLLYDLALLTLFFASGASNRVFDALSELPPLGGYTTAVVLIGGVIVTIYSFVATIITTLQHFPIKRSEVGRIMVTLLVSIVLVFTSTQSVRETLQLTSVLNFCVLSVATAVTFAVPYVRKWHDGSHQKWALVVLFVARPLPFVLWVLLLEWAALTSIYQKQYNWPIAVIAAVWVLVQFPQLRDRYRMTVQYDHIMGTSNVL